MSYLTQLFAEDVTPLLWVIAAAALILLIALFATGRGRLLAPIGLLVAVAIGLLLLERLLVTDRERIDGVIDQLAEAAEQENPEGIVEHLGLECRYGDLNREAIGRLASNVFRTYQIDRVGVSDRKTEVNETGTSGTAQFLAVARGRQGQTDVSPYPTRWILTFSKNSDGRWLVTGIQQIAAFGENRQPLPPRTGLPL